MREIRLARMDKTRPVVVLTREAVQPFLANITVAPITSTVRGISSEVPIGRLNGIAGKSVINFDNIRTISAERLGRHLGYLTDEYEGQIAAAITNAFGLGL